MQAPITNEELNMVKDVHVRKILANLTSVIAEKDQQIIELRNEITDLNPVLLNKNGIHRKTV